MINYLWGGMIVLGLIVAACNGRMDQISPAIFQSLETSVELIIKLLGPMALWLGLMKIARESKLTDFFARISKPLLRFIFPEIPPDDPASASIMLNLTANILGLGNSSTPLGIQAMKDLQRLNKESEQASKAMCTLLALNTSSITIIPAMLISLRAANGSTSPAIIISTSLFATTISTVTALLMDRFFRILYR